MMIKNPGINYQNNNLTPNYLLITFTTTNNNKKKVKVKKNPLCYHLFFEQTNKTKKDKGKYIKIGCESLQTEWSRIMKNFRKLGYYNHIVFFF